MTAQSLPPKLPLPVLFDEDKSKDQGKILRQQATHNKLLMINFHKEFDAKLKEKIQEKTLYDDCKLKVVNAADVTLSDDDLKSFGLVLCLGDDRDVCMFEGSIFSNFEPYPMELKLKNEQGSSKTRMQVGVEKWFQMSKCAFVHSIVDDHRSFQVLENILKTTAPEYMQAQSRHLHYDAGVEYAWERCKVDILEMLVTKKFKQMQDERYVPYTNFVRALEICGVDFPGLEIWEANKFCKIYGVGKSLAQALVVDPETKRWIRFIFF